LKIQDLNLSSFYTSHIFLDELMALLAKLKPQGDVNLSGVNLSRLTLEQVNSLPTGLQIKGLDLSRTNIPPAVLMALLAKLKPETSFLPVGFG